MFSFIKKGLQKTVDAISSIIPDKKPTISRDELENILLESDVEYALVEILMREFYQNENFFRINSFVKINNKFIFFFQIKCYT